MAFEEYIQPELLVLVGVLYIIGYFLKHSKMDDKYIPLVLMVISIMLCVIYVISTCEIEAWKCLVTSLFTAITQGILIAGTSVFTNQMYKQLSHDKQEDKDHENHT